MQPRIVVVLRSFQGLSFLILNFFGSRFLYYFSLAVSLRLFRAEKEDFYSREGERTREAKNGLVSPLSGSYSIVGPALGVGLGALSWKSSLVQAPSSVGMRTLGP